MTRSSAAARSRARFADGLGRSALRCPQALDHFPQDLLRHTLCYWLNHVDHAPAIYAKLLPDADINVTVPPFLGQWWPASYYLGLLAETMSDADKAVEHYEQALAMTEKEKSPPLAAHVQRALGASLLRRARPGDEARGRDLLSSALATAERLGMPPLAEQARALLET